MTFRFNSSIQTRVIVPHATNHNTHQEQFAVESLGNCTSAVHVKSFIVNHYHQSQQYKVQSINHSNRITITVDRSLTRSWIFCWMWVDPKRDMNCVSKLFFRILLFRLHFICLAVEWIELKCNRRVANKTYRNGLAVVVDEEDVHEWFWYDSDDDQNSARPETTPHRMNEWLCCLCHELSNATNSLWIIFLWLCNPLLPQKEWTF